MSIVKVIRFHLNSFFSTDLIIPTATVYYKSLTANLPKGGYSEKASTTKG